MIGRADFQRRFPSLLIVGFLFSFFHACAIADESTSPSANTSAINEETAIKEESAVEEESAIEEEQTQSDSEQTAAANESALELGDYPFRFVGFFQSQLAELVPRDFTPVKMEAFVDALKRFAESDDRRRPSRIETATYVARLDGSTLSSDRSELAVFLQRDGVTNCKISPCNLIVDQRVIDASDSVFPSQLDPDTPDNAIQLATDADGVLQAAIEGKSKTTATVPFAWRAFGTPTRLGYRFDLRIPNSPQATFKIEVPSDTVLESLDGAATRNESDGKVNYTIDAGGLSRIRFQTIKSSHESQDRSMIIRQSRMEYNVERSGIFWIHRMVVSVPASEQWPAIEVASGNVTTVKINSTDAEIEQTVTRSPSETNPVTLRRIQITPPPGVINSRDAFASVTIMGRSDWDSVTSLPIPRWIGLGVIDASIQAEVQLAIESPMSLIRWSLPSTWQIESVGHAEGFEVHQAVGPFDLDQISNESDLVESNDSELNATDSSQLSSVQQLSNVNLGHPTLWSQVQIAEEATYQASDLWLKLEATDNSVIADGLLDITVNDGVAEPLELRLQEGWDLDGMTFAHSGRTIESLTETRTPRSPTDGTTRSITIWPDASDLRLVEAAVVEQDEAVDPAVNPAQPDPTRGTDDTGASDSGSPANSTGPENDVPNDEGGQFDGDSSPRKRWSLAIEINASRSMEANRASLVLPETWLVRAKTDDESLTVGFTPPEGLNWSSESERSMAVASNGRLNAGQRAFYSEMRRATRFFQPQDMTFGPVQMDRPDISFDAELRFSVVKESSDWIESLRVQLQSANANLAELQIATGPAEGRGEYMWMVTQDDGSTTYSFSPADVQCIDPDGEGLCILDVSRVDLQNATITGKRRYKGQTIRTRLPHVVGASSVVAEAYFAKGIELLAKDAAVQAVPLVLPTEESLGQVQHHLRYEAVEQPLIEIAPTAIDPEVNVISQSNVRIVASSRGSDRIEAIYRVGIAKPFRIQYDPSLQLVSLSRDSVEIDIANVPQRPIVIDPIGFDRAGIVPSSEASLSTQDVVPETIRIVWQRNQFQSNPTRIVRVPRIEPDAVLLHQEYRLMSSPDSFLPAELFGAGQSTGENPIANPSYAGQVYRRSGVIVRPGQEFRLVRRNITLALGWLLSILVYAAGWHVMRRSPFMVAAFVIVLATVTFQWWPWRLPIAGWLIAPLVVAGMMVAARAWNAGTGASSLATGDPDSESRKKQSKAPSDPNKDPPDDLSLSFFGTSIFRVHWIAVSISAFTFAGSESTFAQQDSQANSAKENLNRDSQINILVPVDSDGGQIGDVVYVPKDLKSRLFPSKSKTQPERVLLQSAEYRMKIPDLAVSGTDLRETLIEVDFRVLLPDTASPFNEIVLPIASQNVRRMEWFGDNSRILRFTSNDDGQTLATLPNSADGRLRITLVPTYENRGQSHRFTLPIPKVYDSTLSVEADGDVRVLRVGGADGRLMSETDLRRWVQSIGPTDSLEIDFRSSVSATGGMPESPSRLQRRYWVSAGQQQVTIECEVDPSRAIAAGEPFSFVIRDPAIPIITSANWRIVSTELYNPSRRSMTVVSIKESPGPVRLLWTVPVKRPMGSQPLWSQTVDLPEVIASSLGENAPAWIAFQSTLPLQWDPILESAEPLAVDSFLAGWSGFRGRIQRSIVAMDQMPSPVLRVVRRPRGVVDASHRLHLTDRNWELEYSASLRPASENPSRFTLDVPATADVLDLRVNDRRLRTAGIETNGRRIIRLGDFTRDEVVQVSLRANRRLGRRQRFTPPVALIRSATDSLSDRPQDIDPWSSQVGLVRNDVYSVSKDQSCSVNFVEPFRVNAVQSVAMLDAPMLLAGRLPVATWTLRGNADQANNGGNGPLNRDPIDAADDVADIGDANSRSAKQQSNSGWGGKFSVLPRRDRIDCEQVISLMRKDGRWLFAVDIKVDQRSTPEYIDVEIPNRWSDELTVSPQTIWGQSVSETKSTSIVRLSFGGDRFKDQPVRIQGKLQTVDDGKISVPRIRVLGVGRRTGFARTPNRLVNETIRWRENGVRKEPLPAWFLQSNEQNGDFSTYRLIAPSWSIGLAPLPKTDLTAVASIQDNQVFVKDDSVVVLSHWDLAPGNRSSFVVNIPGSAKPLAAWCGGRAIDAGVFKDSEDLRGSQSADADVSLSRQADGSPKQIRLPLVVSRLPQTVRLMIELPLKTATLTKSYLPQPVDTPIYETWLVTYRRNSSVAAGPNRVVKESRQAEERSRRRLSLARSAVESVESAVDLLVDRPSEEVAQWLRQWIGRYRELAAADGHTVDFSNDFADGVSGEINGPMNPPGLATEAEPGGSWALLDNRLSPYANRYFSDDDAPLASLSPTNQSPETAGGTLASETTWANENTLSSELVSVDYVSAFGVGKVQSLGSVEMAPRLSMTSISNVWIRDLFTRFLMLLLVVFILICARSIRHWFLPYVVHPAIWMAAMALIGFIIAPPYVAAALLLVAVCLPVFPSKQKRWEWAFNRR